MSSDGVPEVVGFCVDVAQVVVVDVVQVVVVDVVEVLVKLYSMVII